MDFMQNFYHCNIKTFVISSSDLTLQMSLIWQHSAKGHLVNREMFVSVMVRGSSNSALVSVHMMILKSITEEAHL